MVILYDSSMRFVDVIAAPQPPLKKCTFIAFTNVDNDLQSGKHVKSNLPNVGMRVSLLLRLFGAVVDSLVVFS